MRITKNDLIEYVKWSRDYEDGDGPGDGDIRQKIIDIINEYYKMRNKTIYYVSRKQKELK